MSLFFLFLICIFFYCPIWLNYKLEYATLVNQSYYIYSDIFTDQTVTLCNIDKNIQRISSYLNAFFSTIIPFFVLITLSIMLIFTVWILRKRIAEASSTNNKTLVNRSRRDFHFVCSILFLDIFFLLLYFPYGLFLIFESYFPSYFQNDFFYIYYYLQTALGYLYQTSSATSIFVYLFFNKSFRSELLRILLGIYKAIENHFSTPPLLSPPI